MKGLRSSAIAMVVTLLLVSTHTCVAQAGAHQGTLNWGASPATGVTYTVKRSTVSGGPYTVIKSGLTVLTYVDTGLVGSTKYCYVVTATAAPMSESVPTNEACGSTTQDQTPSPGSLAVTVQ